MKKKIGTSKPMKKYVGGGTAEGKPVIKGVAETAKKIIGIEKENERREAFAKKILEKESRNTPRPKYEIKNPPLTAPKYEAKNPPVGMPKYEKLKKGGSVKSKKK